MRQTDVAVVGGGPAGLSAAIAAAEQGARVTLLERDPALGGQLNKQTHMFFGSEKQHASERGMDIAETLRASVAAYGGQIDVLTGATALGLYADGVLTAEHGGRFCKLKPKAIVVATGASEKFLTFPNNDLPGICGAGAVQTLMNLYGVKPADRVVMVGAGNIGLIVSYQLMQAGVEVLEIIDAAPKIGGYLVHAAKIRRMGVPISVSTVVARAHGTQALTGVTLVNADAHFQPIPGTERRVDCDCLCIAVGLSPLTELLWQAGAEMRYVPQLGGHVAVHGGNMETSVPGLFVAGDAAAVEEASAAMVEGRLAGLSAAKKAGFSNAAFDGAVADCVCQLAMLRSGASAAKIRSGIAALIGEEARA